MSSMVELADVTRTYRRGAEDVRAIDGIDLSVDAGDYLSVVGPSGSGKTTLLNIIGCLDRPTAGSVRVQGVEVDGLKENALSAIRSRTVGFVFQHFFLVPTLTAQENVMMPVRFAGRKVPRLKEKARGLMKIVGMLDRVDHLPSQLSGGEMQRVAIARALINDPAIMLADEPTGNLDSVNAQGIMDLFERLNGDGLTIVVVTHNEELAACTSASVEIRGGRITGRRLSA